MFKKIINKVYEWAYRRWRKRAPPRQRTVLPETLAELDEYREKYGVYPGELVLRDGDHCLVLSVEGPPTINARIEYENLETGEQYTTGLANFQRKLNRKT